MVVGLRGSKELHIVKAIALDCPRHCEHTPAPTLVVNPRMAPGHRLSLPPRPHVVVSLRELLLQIVKVIVLERTPAIPVVVGLREALVMQVVKGHRPLELDKLRGLSGRTRGDTPARRSGRIGFPPPAQPAKAHGGERCNR